MTKKSSREIICLDPIMPTACICGAALVAIASYQISLEDWAYYDFDPFALISST